MKYLPFRSKTIYCYMFFPPNGSEIPYLIPPARRLLKHLCTLPAPHFFSLEFDIINVDLETMHPVDIANVLVREGLLIDTHISFN